MAQPGSGDANDRCPGRPSHGSDAVVGLHMIWCRRARVDQRERLRGRRRRAPHLAVWGGERRGRWRCRDYAQRVADASGLIPQRSSHVVSRICGARLHRSGRHAWTADLLSAPRSGWQRRRAHLPSHRRGSVADAAGFPGIRQTRASGACKLAANARVKPEVRDELGRATGSTKTGKCRGRFDALSTVLLPAESSRTARSLSSLVSDPTRRVLCDGSARTPGAASRRRRPSPRKCRNGERLSHKPRRL